MSSSGRGEGSIREAGGAFGKLEAAREEKYFYDLNEKQIQNLKKDLDARGKETSRDETLNENERLTTEAARQRERLAKDADAE